MRRRSNISPSKSEIADAAAGDETPLPAPLVPAEVASRTASAGALPDTAALLDVIARAARDPEVNVEKMQQLFALKERIEAGAAKRAYYAALAKAKGEFGPILKTRLVDYPHKAGDGRTSYKYEEFADIGAVVDPVLSKYGLSYRHKSSQDGPKIKVTCILSHEDGYSEENSLEGLEDKSGMKNPNQAIASTVTYLQRYTLKEAIGIGAGRDDDGADGPPKDPVIEAEDILYVETLIRDTESDLPKFLETIGTPSIAEMHVSQYKRAIALLNEKKRRASTSQQQ